MNRSTELTNRITRPCGRPILRPRAAGVIVAALTIVVVVPSSRAAAFGRRSIEYGTLRPANFSLVTL